jgi:transglutaminase-like putative cysteine protease
LWGIRQQVSDSIAYAREWCLYDNARDIFRQLKAHTTYKHDPPDIELLQSLPTLMDNNYWGSPGLGDCDCFTIAFTACCKAKGVPVKIVLAGRQRDQFVHIYNLAKVNGTWFDADLTEPNFGDRRPYKFLKIVGV